MDTIPDDLLNNIAELTKHLKVYTNPSAPTNNIDISDLLPKPIVAPPRNDFVEKQDSYNSFGNLQVSSNVPGLEKRLLGATPDIKCETERVLNIKPQNDDHSEFKVDVKELSNIEDLISEYMEIISKLKKKKQELRQKTLNHMVHHKIDTAKVSKKESYSVVTTKKKINPTTKVRLPNKIRDYFIKEENMDDSKAEELAKKIVKWVHANAEYQSAKVLRHKKLKEKTN